MSVRYSDRASDQQKTVLPKLSLRQCGCLVRIDLCVPTLFTPPKVGLTRTRAFASYAFAKFAIIKVKIDKTNPFSQENFCSC